MRVTGSERSARRRVGNRVPAARKRDRDPSRTDPRCRRRAAQHREGAEQDEERAHLEAVRPRAATRSAGLIRDRWNQLTGAAETANVCEMKRLAPFVLAGLVVFAGFTAGARGNRRDLPVLNAVVGANDSFTIAVNDANGKLVKRLAPGTYTVVVHDLSAIHNFHLASNEDSTVNFRTDVPFVGDQTFTVTFKEGVLYTYACEPHWQLMFNSFFVTSAPQATTTPWRRSPSRRPNRRRSTSQEAEAQEEEAEAPVVESRCGDPVPAAGARERVGRIRLLAARGSRPEPACPGGAEASPASARVGAQDAAGSTRRSARRSARSASRSRSTRPTSCSRAPAASIRRSPRSSNGSARSTGSRSPSSSCGRSTTTAAGRATRRCSRGPGSGSAPSRRHGAATERTQPRSPG